MKYSERKYILNTLYIDKYILWVQVNIYGAFHLDTGLRCSV